VSHELQVRPVKVTRWQPELRVWVRRVVCYRVRCSCGELDERAGSVGEARRLGEDHRRERRAGAA
jgi:hypothetical protein